MNLSGELFQVSMQGHVIFAKNYLGNVDPSISLYDVYKEMSKLGWIRVALRGYMGQTILTFNSGVMRRVSPKQMLELKDMAIENNVYEITDESAGKRYPVKDL